MVGVSLAGQDAGLYALECEGEVTGLLLGASAASSGGQADTAGPLPAAQQVWQPAGSAAWPGSSACRAARRRSDLRLSNAAAVYGNACAGGVVGSPGRRRRVLAGARNSGPVQALAGYDAAVSPLAGQFFGGVAGYSAGVTLQGCRNTAAPAQENPPQGDFTGGLVGFLCGGMANCETSAQAAGIRRPVCRRAGRGGVRRYSRRQPQRGRRLRTGPDRRRGGLHRSRRRARNCAATGSVTALAGVCGRPGGPQ